MPPLADGQRLGLSCPKNEHPAAHRIHDNCHYHDCDFSRQDGGCASIRRFAIGCGTRAIPVPERAIPCAGRTKQNPQAGARGCHHWQSACSTTCKRDASGGRHQPNRWLSSCTIRSSRAMRIASRARAMASSSTTLRLSSSREATASLSASSLPFHSTSPVSEG